MSGFRPPGQIPESLRSGPPGLIPESLRSCPPGLILTAHGSADPRSAATVERIADEVRAQRPGLDVTVAFCERSEPNLRDVLAALHGPAVVTPLLLASAYHARADIPAIVAASAAGRSGDIVQADTLGEDPRLIRVLNERIAELDTPQHGTAVLVVAVGSSHPEANLATESLAGALGGHWTAVRVAYATTQPSVADAITDLREAGARRIVLAPWFIAPGRITDRVADIATAEGISMADPLGAHRLVAETVLDRYHRAAAARLAA